MTVVVTKSMIGDDGRVELVNEAGEIRRAWPIDAASICAQGVWRLAGAAKPVNPEEQPLTVGQAEAEPAKPKEKKVLTPRDLPAGAPR